MHVNAPQDTKETADMVVSKEKLKLDVAQILIVLITLNVNKDLVHVDQDLKQLGQFVLISTSVTTVHVMLPRNVQMFPVAIIVLLSLMTLKKSLHVPTDILATFQLVLTLMNAPILIHVVTTRLVTI
jgi:hypothetical protein